MNLKVRRRQLKSVKNGLTIIRINSIVTLFLGHLVVHLICISLLIQSEFYFAQFVLFKLSETNCWIQPSLFICIIFKLLRQNKKYYRRTSRVGTFEVFVFAHNTVRNLLWPVPANQFLVLINALHWFTAPPLASQLHTLMIVKRSALNRISAIEIV